MTGRWGRPHGGVICSHTWMTQRNHGKVTEKPPRQGREQLGMTQGESRTCRLASQTHSRFCSGPPNSSLLVQGKLGPSSPQSTWSPEPPELHTHTSPSHPQVSPTCPGRDQRQLLYPELCGDSGPVQSRDWARAEACLHPGPETGWPREPLWDQGHPPENLQMSHTSQHFESHHISSVKWKPCHLPTHPTRCPVQMEL